MKFFNGLGIRCIRGRYKDELILFLLETGWDITCRVSGLFKLQVLRLVRVGKGVAHNFPLTSKLVSVANSVTSKIVTCLSVTKKARFVGLYWLSLHFETEVWVKSLDNPSADVMIVGVD